MDKGMKELREEGQRLIQELRDKQDQEDLTYDKLMSPSPVTLMSTRVLMASVRDWISNRKANGYDTKLLEDELQHLGILLDKLNE